MSVMYVRGVAITRMNVEKRRLTYPLVSLPLDAERPVFTSVSIVADGDACIGRHLRLPFRLHRSPFRHCRSFERGK